MSSIHSCRSIESISIEKELKNVYRNASQSLESKSTFVDHDAAKGHILLLHHKLLEKSSNLLIERYILCARIKESHQKLHRSLSIPSRNSDIHALHRHLENINKHIANIIEEVSFTMSLMRSHVSPQYIANFSQRKKPRIILDNEHDITKRSIHKEFNHQETKLRPIHQENTITNRSDISGEKFKQTEPDNKDAYVSSGSELGSVFEKIVNTHSNSHSDLGGCLEKTDDSRRSFDSDVGSALENTEKKSSMTHNVINNKKLTPTQHLFTTRVNQLQDYEKMHGNLNVPCKYSPLQELGDWASTRRKRYKLIQAGKTRPTQAILDQNKILTEMGFIWDVNEWMWEKTYREIKKFKEEHGHLQIPRTPETSKVLRNWIHTQRSEYRKFVHTKNPQITQERIDKLNEVGFIWESSTSFWEKKFNDLLDYKEKYGTINMKWNKEVRSLAEWTMKQRKECDRAMIGENTYLAKDQIERLQMIGIFGNQQS